MHGRFGCGHHARAEPQASAHSVCAVPPHPSRTHSLQTTAVHCPHDLPHGTVARVHPRRWRDATGTRRPRTPAGRVAALPDRPCRWHGAAAQRRADRPRGNGKTTLLNWFQRACGNSETPVDAITLTPRDIPTFETLVDALTPRRGFRKLLPRKLAIASVGSAEGPQPDSGRRNLTRELLRRCRKRPLAALVDEAHTLDLTVGGTLLNASQRVRSQAPFLLVLAGTPGLPAHLDAMDASFWGRLGEGHLGVGLLDQAAAAEALTKPLAAHGISVAANALDIVLQHGQRYPYFLQLWGDALWKRHLATHTNALTAADAMAVQPAVAMLVAEYHQVRYRELETAQLQAAAKAVALVFQTNATATDHDIDAALADAGMDNPATRIASREALGRFGYIWCPPNQTPPVVWSAGIPSLMAYVLERV